MIRGHLLFGCAGRPFALRLEAVVEVFRMVAVAAPVPRGPRDCLGLVDYHGQLVPALDLAVRLGLCAPRRPVNLVSAYLVFVTEARGTIALVVDELREIAEEEEEPLSGGGGAQGRLLVGAVRRGDGTLVPVLDRDALLTVRIRQLLRQAVDDRARSSGGAAPEAG